MVWCLICANTRSNLHLLRRLREQLQNELASRTNQTEELRLKREQLAVELEERLAEERYLI